MIVAAGLLLSACAWKTATGAADAVPEKLPETVRIHLLNDSTFLVTGAVARGDSIFGLWQPIERNRAVGAPEQRTVERIQVSYVEVHARRPVMIGVAALMVAGFATLLAVQ